MHTRHSWPRFALLFAALLGMLSTGCGSSRAPGDTTCDREGDCYDQLGDPPADASWRCVERQCTARGAGPFEAEPGPTDEPTSGDEGSGRPPPPMPADRVVRCQTVSDCAVLGAPPSDASWECANHECSLRGAGPFEADEALR